jgi:hypothetical protein
MKDSRCRRYHDPYGEVSDAGPLLRLMRQLARFEGYAEHFTVTEADLIERGLAASKDAQRSFFSCVFK